MKMASSKDRNGIEVFVGTKVRVLSIHESVPDQLPPEEAARVKTMLGEVFSVYEIDESGSAWVEKWWYPSTDQSLSHSLGLAPAQMEVVADAK
jgi:hypothetical protein